MENQYYIFPVGRLENVEINVEGVKTTTNFEVIEIMVDKDSYPVDMDYFWHQMRAEI
jgi:hypothetical protein